MSEPTRPRFVTSLAAAFLLVAAQSGCTSALTTAYLRDGLWTGADHAASAEPESDGPDDAQSAQAAGAEESAPVADRDRREAALREAMARLSRLGTLDPAIESALVATLQRTEPEDWPVVVEEFTASLAAADAPIETKQPPSAVAIETHTAEVTPEPAAPATAAVESDAVPAGAAEDDAPQTAPPAAHDATPAPPVATPAPPVPAVAAPLAVRKACFASAVRAWGDVDRFAADRFRPGQEVIVYLELDNLTASPSPAGHTTCIDAVLRLVDGADHTLHTWTFEPIAETSADRRRDYFARYVVCIPESLASGDCRVEVDVTDTLAGATAGSSLPLEIAAAE